MRIPKPLTITLASLMVSSAALCASQDLGNGFQDHGVAVPISNHRGATATVDGDGRDVVLSWLMDHRGGYELLMVDAETGKTAEFPLPFLKEVTEFDAPFSSLQSSKNRFYTHLNNYFVEFDPTKRDYTFWKKTTPQMAMSMTEDDNGVIWSATYPDSGIVSYDPATKALRDYGSVYKQNWKQYPRYIAADDTGYIYFAIGNTNTQIIALDPKSGEATPILKDDDRVKGMAYVYRDLDGKVYGSPSGDKKDHWIELYKGEAKPLEKHDEINEKKYLSGSQAFFHKKFPDGKRVVDCDLVNRKITIEDPKTGKTTESAFNYNSDGAIVMGVALAANHSLSGGSAFPMHTFEYDPKTDKMIDRPGYGQWNTTTPWKDHYFVGAYPGGLLLDWQPAKPWVRPDKDRKDTNPVFIRGCDPDIHRPTCVYPHPDGKTVILAGTPDYGYTGGGLLFWNRETNDSTLLTDKDLIPDQSTASLLALPDGKLLGVTTTAPGTGGEKKATVAEFYIMDFATRKIEWHAPLIPGASEYLEIHPATDGKVFGVADRKTFFVFDPATKKIMHQEDVAAKFGDTSSQQGPRIFIDGPDKSLYLLFKKGIARIDPATYALTMVAEAPKPIDSGGDYYDGRIYFVCGSHICSWGVK